MPNRSEMKTYAYSPKIFTYLSKTLIKWQVNIAETEKKINKKKKLQAKKDEFQTYQIFSKKNVGNSEVYNVQVEVFRNEPKNKNEI